MRHRVPEASVCQWGTPQAARVLNPSVPPDCLTQFLEPQISPRSCSERHPDTVRHFEAVKLGSRQQGDNACLGPVDRMDRIIISLHSFNWPCPRLSMWRFRNQASIRSFMAQPTSTATLQNAAAGCGRLPPVRALP